MRRACPPACPSVFGVDLDALATIRVHTGAAAAEAAAAISAEAFTGGRGVHFAAGAFAPDTDAGRHLLAHEVVHALGAPAAAGQPGALRVSTPDQAEERHAEDVATAFVRARVAVAEDADGAAGAPPPPPALLVEGSTPADELLAGQLRKSELAARLRAALTAAADAELAPERTTEGCPYLAHIFAYYESRSAEHVERALRHYLSGGAATVRDAARLIPPVVERVRLGVRAWRLTARLPAEAVALAPRMAEPAAPGRADVQERLGTGAAIDNLASVFLSVPKLIPPFFTFGHETFKFYSIHTCVIKGF